LKSEPHCPRGPRRRGKIQAAAFFTRGLENRIVTGNFDDDLKLCAEADWNHRGRRGNLRSARIARARRAGAKTGAIVSRIPRACRSAASRGLPEEWQQHWAGTHFFNPPRYLKLVEIIPGL